MAIASGLQGEISHSSFSSLLYFYAMWKKLVWFHNVLVTVVKLSHLIVWTTISI